MIEEIRAVKAQLRLVFGNADLDTLMTCMIHIPVA